MSNPAKASLKAEEIKLPKKASGSSTPSPALVAEQLKAPMSAAEHSVPARVPLTAGQVELLRKIAESSVSDSVKRHAESMLEEGSISTYEEV